MSAFAATPSDNRLDDPRPQAPAEPGIFTNVVAAVDDSDPAKWAIDAALPLVKKTCGKLSLLHAAPYLVGWTAEVDIRPDDLCKPDAENNAILQEASRRVPKELLGEKILREGSPEQRIIDTVRSLRADLLAIGTHNRNAAARFLLGSTAELAVRYASCPVLVVGRPVSPAFRDNGPRRILIAVDDSQQAGWAASLGIRLAESFAATVILVHVVPDVIEFPATYGDVPQATLQETVRRAGEAFLAKFLLPAGEQAPIERVLCEGAAAREIITAARENDADLIVIGTHGRHGLSRLLLGSTAEAVLRHAHCPVICVGQEH